MWWITKKQTGEMFPFIFELAEKMGFSENVKDSKFQHPSGTSSEAVEGEKKVYLLAIRILLLVRIHMSLQIQDTLRQIDYNLCDF
jgi:hypothetical protein